MAFYSCVPVVGVVRNCTISTSDADTSTATVPAILSSCGPPSSHMGSPIPKRPLLRTGRPVRRPAVPRPVPSPAYRLMVGRGGRLTLMGFCEAPFSPLPRLLGARFGTLAIICPLCAILLRLRFEEFHHLYIAGRYQRSHDSGFLNAPAFNHPDSFRYPEMAPVRIAGPLFQPAAQMAFVLQV